MKDLISRQAAINAILHNQEVYSNNFGDDAIDKYTIAIIDIDAQTIALLPSAERHGKWILDENPHDGDCRCSVCGVAIDAMNERNHEMLNILTGGKWWTFYHYCPKCGASMDEVEKE